MKQKRKALIVCIAIPLAVGGLAALISGGGMAAFERVNKPPLSPPGAVFPIAWTVLYILMGLASYLVLASSAPAGAVRTALAVYAVQLAVNFMWPILFFAAGAYLPSFILLVCLWLLVLTAAILFYRISKPAGLLMLPYLLWLTFAGYLNLGIYLLN